jgi:hypothetical protein
MNLQRCRKPSVGCMARAREILTLHSPWMRYPGEISRLLREAELEAKGIFVSCV